MSDFAPCESAQPQVVGGFAPPAPPLSPQSVAAAADPRSTDGGYDSDASKAPVRNAFSALMGPRKRPGEEVGSPEDARIWCAIYRITLLGVFVHHPLYGIVYIGQATRCKAKTALEAAKIRWKQEVCDSKTHNNEVGLLWALKEFGESAFRFEVIDSKFAPKSELNNWADSREIELIAKHGGVLKDQNKRCEQTLNLDPGGQGSRGLASAAMWKVVRAKNLDRFKKEMDAYVKEYKSSLVPTLYVTPGGYKLGEKLDGFRQGTLRDGMSDKEATEKWAEALPKWAWNATKTEEWHAAQSKRLREWMDNATAEDKAVRIAKITATMNKPENRAANSKRAREQWDKPENRAAQSKRSIERLDNETEEDKAKRIAKMTAAMNKPENRAASSKRAIERLDNETEKERADRLAKKKKTVYATTDATLVGLTGKKLESRRKTIAKQRRADANLADELLLYQAANPGAKKADMRRAKRDGSFPK